MYNLRVSSDQFWHMTPREYDLLCQRHREDLCHKEMVSAFTTAAVVNHSFSPPEKAVAPIVWMPNYKASAAAPATPATPEQHEAKSGFDAQVAQLTAELKAYAVTGVAGPALIALGYSSKV